MRSSRWARVVRVQVSGDAARAAVTVVSAVALLAGGCAVGPDFTKPDPQMPAGWVGTNAEMQRSAGADGSFSVPRYADLATWWSTLNDPELTSLEERGIAGNLDLVQAKARIREARAARDIAVAALFPTVALSAGVTRSSSQVNGTWVYNNLFQVGGDALWEIDVFGGIRRNIEAATADVSVAVNDERGVMVTLTAEIALTYADLRGGQSELAVARGNLAVQEQTAAIVRDRLDAGFVTELDVDNADAEAATTRARIPQLEAAIRQSIYAMAVLLGDQPAALVDELSVDGPLPAVPGEVPVALPSDLLRRRPDIRRAEANYHAAMARIGVATSDLFPHFFLGAGANIGGPQFKSAFTVGNASWQAGPSATWTAFDGGANLANVEAHKAQSDEVFAAYRQSILTALSEVETAIVVYAKEQQRHHALDDAVTSGRKALEIATLQYTEGKVDFLNVLAPQRTLFASEDALVQSDRLVVQNLVTLYKTLGGGWEVPPPGEHEDDGVKPNPAPASPDPPSTTVPYGLSASARRAGPAAPVEGALAFTR